MEAAMKPETKNLLVVDDEKIVCDSCARILGDRGYAVETSTDPSKALKLATEKDYAVILLDIKMPTVDGLEFLEELRKRQKNVRVVMITGYSTPENTAAAKRLGAVDIVPKPFSPDELLNAVTKLLPVDAPRKEAAVKEAAVAVEAKPVAAEVPRGVEYSKEYYFLDETWMQRAAYNSVRVGAFLSSEETRSILSIQLPKVGDMVYRGLPIAAITVEGKPLRIIPSPVTGEVVEVNPALAGAKADTWTKPCKTAWIANIRPANLEEDLLACSRRSVVLVATDDKRVKQQAELLADLGCTVEVTSTLEATSEAVRRNKSKLLVIDATSSGNKGPDMVKYFNSTLPEVKVVAIATQGSKYEAEYRANKILYYAMEPLAETEVIDVLNSVFGPTLGPAPEVAPSRKLPNWICKISITNRQGRKVNLLSSGEVLFSHKGLGLRLRDLIFGKSYPITFTLGAKNYSVIDIINEVENCDRLLFLEAKDVGRIPGSVVVTSGSELLKGMGSGEHKIKTLTVQPSGKESPALVFDARSSRALAEFILKEMTSN
jgi:CheY-like chemotaxis protein/glycine cleavage system H lipoate-binding protein